VLARSGLDPPVDVTSCFRFCHLASLHGALASDHDASVSASLGTRAGAIGVEPGPGGEERLLVASAIAYGVERFDVECA
jgi:hypothetical protein